MNAVLSAWLYPNYQHVVAVCQNCNASVRDENITDTPPKIIIEAWKNARYVLEKHFEEWHPGTTLELEEKCILREIVRRNSYRRPRAKI